MGSKSRALAAQTAEYQRQAQIEAERAAAAAEAQRQQWAQQQADAERRYNEQLDFQRQEAERQRLASEAFTEQVMGGQQQMMAAFTRAQEEERARAEEKAARSRQYAEGRNSLIDKAKTDINAAYQGFDANYFDKFAQDFVSYYKPKLDQQQEQANREATFSYADSGNLRSTAAARSFGDLNRQGAEKAGEIANSAVDSANSFKDSIDSQKSDALSLLFASGAVGAENLPDGYDEGGVSALLGGIGSQLGAITQTQANKARTIAAPNIGASGLNLNFSTRLPGQRAA